MQASLSLITNPFSIWDGTMPLDVKLQFRTNNYTPGHNGRGLISLGKSKGVRSRTRHRNLYGGGRALRLRATHYSSCMLATAPINRRLRPCTKYCPARGRKNEDDNTSDLTLSFRGTISFIQSFADLGSQLHYDLSDHHDVDARIKKVATNTRATNTMAESSTMNALPIVETARPSLKNRTTTNHFSNQPAILKA